MYVFIIKYVYQYLKVSKEMIPNQLHLMNISKGYCIVTTRLALPLQGVQKCPSNVSQRMKELLIKMKKPKNDP